jgi:TorA maturation chaperone TorD
MSPSSRELLIPEGLSEEDLLRAQIYHLLARFLSATPTTETLAAGGQMSGGETPLGVAVQGFALACRQCNAAVADDEYSDLFIGVGRGELLPYASYYLTGFLNEKPLARLREDMSALGVARRDGVTEPEDHVASILETMGGLIDGRFGAPLSLSHQKDFFDTHIASWMPVFFRDLEEASSSVLYAALAVVARRFFEIEAQAFAFEGAKWPS